ncbi:Kinase [Hexamita inflata]|uniref:non-specific serine/threonine protein kinase n=1 Tax=Hexamita inflata TaxID=28002 RepID=A0AA86P5N0_9EUKA|nr:Kinase [Hexamita inflata]
MFGDLKNMMNKSMNKVQAIVKNDNFVGKFFQVQNQTIEVTRQLAQGSFAYVYDTSNPEFVIKHMIIQTKEQLKEALAECQFQAQLNHHQNIAKVFAAFVDDRQIALDTKYEALKDKQLPCDFNIVIERCSDSVLGVLNKQKGSIPEEQIYQIFAGTVAGFTAQHNLQIINRDGKIENLLLKSASNPFTYQNIRICDFGSCTQKQYEDGTIFIKNSQLRSQMEQEIQSKTTPQYRAPEMIDLFARMPITSKADVFALGVMLYRLMYKVLPFPEGEILANFNIRYQFPDETDEYKKRGKYEEKSTIPIYSPELKNLVRRMITKDPRQRPSIFEIAKELEAKIGNFGAEPENIQNIEVEENANSAPKVGLIVNQNMAPTQAGIGGLFDWAPVSEQSQSQSQPQPNLMDVNPIQQPKPAGGDLFDWAPAEPKVSQPDKQPQMPAMQAPMQPQADLFDWAPQPQSQQTPPPQQNSQPQTPIKQQQDFFDFQPIVQQQAPVQPPIQQQVPVMIASKPQQPQESLLDFMGPSVVQQQPIQQQQQQSNQAPKTPVQFNQQSQATNPFDVLMKGLNADLVPANISNDILIQNVRRIACGIFTAMNLTPAKIQDRYTAMFLLLKQCFLTKVPVAQVQSLEANFQMLVQQAQTTQNKKEETIQVLKDLCTVQQLAVNIATLKNSCEYTDSFKVAAPTQIQTVQKLIQIVNGAHILQKNSPNMQKFNEYVQLLVVRPILRTAKTLFGFGATVDQQLAHQVKTAYLTLSQQKEVFGVHIPEVIELGEF